MTRKNKKQDQLNTQACYDTCAQFERMVFEENKLLKISNKNNQNQKNIDDGFILVKNKKIKK